MQLFYGPTVVPHITRTLLSLPSTTFLHVSPPIPPFILHVVHVPHYLMYISVLYYSSDPTRARFLKGRCGFYLFKFDYHVVSSLLDLRVKAQQNMINILCSHYFFVDGRRRLKICLILRLNLTILRGTLPITPCIPIPLFIQSSHLLPCKLALCPSTYPLYSLVSSLYSYISPSPSIYPLYLLVSSLYSHISPSPSRDIYPLLPCIVFVLPYFSVPCTLLYVPVLSYIPVAFYVFPLFSCHLFSYNTFMNLQDNSLGNSSVKPRSKRSYHHRHSTKLSMKDLALELAKKHVSSKLFF